MRTFDTHEAKTQRSRLVDQVAKAGKPMVKVTAIDAEAPKSPQRLGFLDGQIQVPEDFDTMGLAEMEAMFHGEP